MKREELIELVKKIIEAEGTEEQLLEDINIFKKNVPHPSPVNLIYQQEFTPEEIVDKALSYKPFML